MGVVAALLGTALGVVFFTEPMRSLYYGSYSLPPLPVYWSWEIFVKCAVVPAVALILITLVVCFARWARRRCSSFCHEASGKSGTKRAAAAGAHGFCFPPPPAYLPAQSGNFATLFVGIAFASLLPLGPAILPTMTHYADNLETSLVAEHQYTLKARWSLKVPPRNVSSGRHSRALAGGGRCVLSAAQMRMMSLTTRPMQHRRRPMPRPTPRSAESPLQRRTRLRRFRTRKMRFYTRLDDLADALGCDRDETINLIEKASKIDTDNDDIHPVNTTDNGTGVIAQAEKYAIYQLQYDRGDGNGQETISVYGISPDSRYWKGLDVGDGRVVFWRRSARQVWLERGAEG